jgi:hypothetical protein
MSTTKSEIVIKTAPAADGIGGYTEEVSGKESKTKSGLFRGTRLKFGKTAEWELKDDGEVIAPETRFVLTDVARIVTRWGLDKKPADLELSSKHMNTRFGGRQRPHFVIHNWVTMPGDGPQQAALPAPAVVKPVTLAEEMNDSLPF